MAVKVYQNENGENRWTVYVNVRSKANRKLRAQRRLSGFKSQKEAEREEIRLIRECERELLEKETQGATWGKVVEAFQAHLFQQRQEGQIHLTTEIDYVAALRLHTPHWWPRLASGITKTDVREVINQMKAKGYSVAHQRKMKLVINRTFIFGIESRLIFGVDHSPTMGITLNRDEEKKPEILTIKEIRQLLEAARRLDEPWYPIWSMALLTGMRNGELHALEWSDVDFENSKISVNKSYNTRFKVVKSTKAGYWRTVPISSELRSLLAVLKVDSERIGRRQVLPRLTTWTLGFQARELRRFCNGIGLPSIRFHTLRACFSTQLIRSGVPPIQIQKICGWRDLKTMQRYIRLAGIEIEGATEALKVLPVEEVSERAAEMFAAPAPVAATPPAVLK